MNTHNIYTHAHMTHTKTHTARHTHSQARTSAKDKRGQNFSLSSIELPKTYQKSSSLQSAGLDLTG